MLLTSLVCLSVFCAASGALFVAAARMAETEGGISARAAASSAYLLEAAGSALGGILASIVLVRFLDSFQIAAMVGLLNICMAAVLVLRMKRGRVAVLAASGGAGRDSAAALGRAALDRRRGRGCGAASTWSASATQSTAI